MTDPIADMLTRIRNGQAASHETVCVPFSTFRRGVLQVMKEEGYIKGYDEKVCESDGHKYLTVSLKYNRDGASVINEIKRISKPGCRVYSSIRDLKNHYNNFGIVILSTSHGVMSDNKARKMNVGGEVLCKIF